MYPSIPKEPGRSSAITSMSPPPLRNDQLWRYEHLRRVEKITGVTVHSVRGKDVHILSANELEEEKPLLEFAPLLDIGTQFPFYEDYMANAAGLTSPEDVWLETQLSLIGRFVHYFGNFGIFVGLWAEAGNQLPEHVQRSRRGSFTLTYVHGFQLSFLSEVVEGKAKYCPSQSSTSWFQMIWLVSGHFSSCFRHSMDDRAQSVNDAEF